MIRTDKLDNVCHALASVLLLTSQCLFVLVIEGDKASGRAIRTYKLEHIVNRLVRDVLRHRFPQEQGLLGFVVSISKTTVSKSTKTS
jgi:hypothetical protein